MTDPKEKIVDGSPNEEDPDELFKKMINLNQEQNAKMLLKFPNGRVTDNVGVRADTPTKRTKIRFLVCSIGVISLAMAQMSRMVLNQTITMMIDERMLNEGRQKAEDNDDSENNPGHNFDNDDELMATTTQISISLTDLDTDPVPVWTFQPSSHEPPTQESVAIVQTENPFSTTAEPQIKGLRDENIVTEKYTSQEVLTTLAPFNEFSPRRKRSIESFAKSSEQNQESPRVEDDEQGVTSSFTPEVESSTEKPPVNRFMWNIKMQQILLGGFYSTYFVFMIIGGRMAEAYGAKYVLLLGVAGSGLINLLTPWMARTNYHMLVGSRAIMGAIQSGVFPGMYALINKWLTMSEAAVYAPQIKMNLRMGMLFGSILPGLMPDWPEVYYLTGALSIIWSIIWLAIATSDPAENAWVSKSELDHILKKKKKKNKVEDGIEMSEKSGAESVEIPKKKKKSTPWLKIVTHPSVIGLIFAKLTINFAMDFIAIVLPSYLSYVHRASKAKVCLVVFIGWLASFMIKKRPFNASKTAIRKIFQGLTNFGVGVSLFILTYNNYSLLFVAIVLQVISFMSMFAAGGETMLPYDLSQEYPATIMAIANSIANISGVTTTVVTTYILGGKPSNNDRWNILINLIAAIVTFGGLLFCFLVKAENINFESNEKTGKRDQQHKSQTDVDVDSIARVAEAKVKSCKL